MFQPADSRLGCFVWASLLGLTAAGCQSPSRHFVPDEGATGGATDIGGRSGESGGGNSGGSSASGHGGANEGGSVAQLSNGGNANGGNANATGGNANGGSGGATTIATSGNANGGSGGATTTATGGNANGGSGGATTTATGGSSNGGSGGATTIATSGNANGGSGGATTTATGGSSNGGSGGATTITTGGTSSATTGTIPLPDGRVCTVDGDCLNRNCRLAPTGVRFCVASGSACASKLGVGLPVGAKRCDGNSSAVCMDKDVFQVDPCQVSNNVCQAGNCDNTSGACVQAPANPGAICPLGSSTGACDVGVCLALRFAPPAGQPWTPVGAGPLLNVPANCGAAGSPPCAEGDFKFAFPPDTRQAKCYDDSSPINCPGTGGADTCATTPYCGQDAQYGADLAVPNWSNNRYVKSGTTGNDVVMDNVTQIVWTPDSTSGLQMPWTKALQFCVTRNASSYGGFASWTMPSIYSLLSLFDLGVVWGGGAATTFPNMSSNYIWAASTVASDSTSSWFAVMGTPYVYLDSRLAPSTQTTFEGRCITSRNSVALSSQRYFVQASVANEPVVFDSRTGFVWPQNHDVTGRTWSQSLSYCESLSYGGRRDWRAPNVLELIGVVDYSRQSPAVDPAVFPGTLGVFYWTSTTIASAPTMAWAVRFQDGALAAWQSTKTGTATSNHPVHCVAGGP